MSNEYVETEYENLSQREHIIKRMNLYLGSKNATENTLWILNKENDQLNKETISYSIAFFNGIFESLQNTVDMCLKTRDIKGLNKCTEIKVNVKENGEISVFNNGQSIEAIKFKNTDQYLVEVIFSEYLSGSNFNNDSDVKIGCNGLGIKLLNTISKVFTVETVDTKNKLLYTQTFEENNSIKNAPIIEKFTKLSKEQKMSHTTLTFLPDYKLFNTSAEEMQDTLNKVLYTYMNYISIYLGEKYKVYYNDELITKNSLSNLSELVLDQEDVIKCKLYNKNNKNEFLEVQIGIFDGSDGQEHISIINGLYVTNSGTYLQYMNKLILDNLKSKIEKKLKDKVKITNKLISNFLFIFIKGDLRNLEFTNQCKNEIKIPLSRFKDYIFDEKVYKMIWSKLEVEFDRIYLDKISTENVSKKTSKLRGIKKYRSADKAGTSESYKCSLFIPEGDSAESCIKNGLTTNKDLGYKYYGIFNIQGVPLNVRKEIDIKEVKKNDKITYIIDRKKKLIDNERFTSLVKVLNLNYSYNYEMNAKGDEEFKTLRYAKVLIAVDFDIDGLGQINGLILNFFNVFFPNLMKRKMFQIFYTPLIRAYPTKKGKFIEEFYNVEDYDLWCAKNNVNDYKINYIKGLATHSNMEIKQMFKKIDNNIYTYEFDNKATEYFEIYFGEDSDKRKKILSSEDEYKEDDFKEKYKNKFLTCSHQLNVNTKEFQLDNIQRKMPHIIDGLNPARRKILAGSLNKFRHSNNKLKVFQLGGYIAEKMFYHHGSDSLNKTIINMAQDFPGSRNIPLLLPIGQFGSRLGGGKDAGSPRYIDTKLNKAITDLLFPHVDDNLLEYHIIDGEIGEPKYFIPVIPLVLLEDVGLPSTGWKIEIYARDLKQVIDNVKSMIKNEDCKIKSMKYFKNKFKGREILNSTYNMLIGNYEIPEKTKDQVIITELPPKVWNENFIESLEKKDFIDDIIDESSIYDVKIKVLFKKGELTRLQTEYESKNEHLDYIEHNLKLYSKLSHCINLYTQKNTVMEFKNYTDIMKHWYIVRKECYFKRIERENIILKYKIIMTESIIRFIENHESYGISKKSDSVAIGILESNCYQMLNKTAIDSPGLIKNEDLENHIININQSYDYLLNLSYRKMNSESYERYKSNLEELKKKLEYYNKEDIYKTIWVEEINKLCKELENGLKKGFYQEDPNLFKK
jgi:DNA topoisomerase-2